MSPSLDFTVLKSWHGPNIQFKSEGFLKIILIMPMYVQGFNFKSLSFKIAYLQYKTLWSFVEIFSLHLFSLIFSFGNVLEITLNDRLFTDVETL